MGPGEDMDMASSAQAICRLSPSLKATHATPSAAAADVRLPMRVSSGISQLQLWLLPFSTVDTAGSLEGQSSQACDLLILPCGQGHRHSPRQAVQHLQQAHVGKHLTCSSGNAMPTVDMAVSAAEDPADDTDTADVRSRWGLLLCPGW